MDSDEPAAARELTPDFLAFKGQERARRALEIVAAGRHNMILFGPPGAGKTFSVRLLPSIMPDLDLEEAIEVTRIHSLAGKLGDGKGLLRRPPFRCPHHGASAEGIVGGGRHVRPGEISLAHRGILFLDEAPEFRKDILDSLREPVEDGSVSLSRAGRSVRFPADFILVLAANPCPCGNLGRANSGCFCTDEEIARHWKRIGGALIDRIDLHVPMKPERGAIVMGNPVESSSSIALRVRKARALQAARLGPRRCNADMDAREVDAFINAHPAILDGVTEESGFDNLSARGKHAIVKTALTIANLENRELPIPSDFRESLEFRLSGPEKITQIFFGTD